MTELYLPVLVPVLATVTWYLVSMATITRPLWSRYPDWLLAWTECPACSSTWYGTAIAGAFELATPLSFFGLRGPVTWALAGLWCTFFCPLLARRLYGALIEMQAHGDPGR